MDIFVTGATGFVGRALCKELINNGHQVRCLVRGGSEIRLLTSAQMQPVSADIFSTEELIPLMKGSDAVIHLVGIIREFKSKNITFTNLHTKATESVIAATSEAGISRYLHMSANGTRDNAISAYHRTKWQAEEAVRSSNLDWTIFRPSLIFGAEDQFINMLVGLIKNLPLVPVMGDGEYKMQPVPVELIAAGFASALENNISIGKTYHCGGGDCISYNRLLDLVGLSLGKSRVRKVPQPLTLMRPAVALLQHLAPFPMTSDQLQMLVEGNCCDATEWAEDLNLSLPTFSESLDYLQQK